MLHKLCVQGKSELVEEYLSKVQDEDSEQRLLHIINQKNSEKYSALHLAIFHRYVFATLNEDVCYKSFFHRNEHLVQSLIKFGADIDAKCHGVPPVHLALRLASFPDSEHLGFAIFTCLAENGANLLLKVSILLQA